MKNSNILESAGVVILGGFWCQQKSAETLTGKSVRASNYRAARWCASGALEEAANKKSSAKVFYNSIGAFNSLSVSVGTNAICWNDSRGQTAKVVGLKMLKLAHTLRSAGE